MNGLMLTARPEMSRKPVASETPPLLGTSPENSGHLDTRKSGDVPRRFNGSGTYGIFTHVPIIAIRDFSTRRDLKSDLVRFKTRPS